MKVEVKFKMTYDDYLYHWGIRGMKWGVRRYQNKDGSLTAAGRKRYDNEVAKLKAEKAKIRNTERTKAKLAKLDSLRNEVEGMKNTPKANALSTNNSSKNNKSPDTTKKSIKDFSDQELQSIVTRMTLEKRYAELMASPKKISRGKKFVTGMWDKAVEPALQTVAKDTVTKLVSNAVNSMLKKDD